MTQTSKFWDRNAEKYARDKISDEASYQHKLDYTRNLFRPDMHILEIACGTGSTALLHAPHVDHILGVDISKAMIAIAERKRLAAGITNITFRQGTITDLDATERDFDMVMAHSILHLLPDPAATVSQIAALLKPGGYFVSSTACIPGLLRAIAPLSRIAAPLGLLPRVTNIMRKNLVQMQRDAGLEILYDWKPEKGMAVFVVSQKPKN